jgi:hypothetical protein
LKLHRGNREVRASRDGWRRVATVPRSNNPAAARCQRNTRRSMLPMATRFGDLRLNTLSWCRRTRISNCNAARDRNSPATAHQTNPQRSPIGVVINRFARSRQPLWVSGRHSAVQGSVRIYNHTDESNTDGYGSTRQRVEGRVVHSSESGAHERTRCSNAVGSVMPAFSGTPLFD